MGDGQGGIVMAKCPKCGTDVSAPAKSWDVAPKKKAGPKLHVELFNCPKCGTKFRVAKKT